MQAEVVQPNDVDVGPILIVDDEVDVHEELAEFLIEQGYLAWHALDADETLGILRQMPEIRILLVDIRMPGRDGLDLISELREAYGDYHECIVITGHGSKEHAISSVRLGLTDFLEKPLHLPALEVALKRAARRLAWKDARGGGRNSAAPAETSLYRRIRDLRGQLDYLRSHDPLTGFLNRPAFLGQSARRLADSGSSRAAVIMADLDRFRQINELHGFAAGDRVLVALAGRIETLAGAGALLGRMSSDRFAILGFFGGDGPDLGSWTTALRERLAEPLPESGIRHPLAVTTASALSGPEQPDAERLVFEAEMALAEGKQRGGNCHVNARASMVAAGSRSNRILDGIRDALLEGRIRPWYQPIVELANSNVWGFEALMRWHQGGEVVSAGTFAGIVKDTDVAPQLDEAVVDAVISDLDEWQHVLPSDRRYVVSVNLWSRTLTDPESFGRVMERLEGFASDRFVLAVEIIEGDLGLLPEAQRERLLAFRGPAQGGLLFLDDFGVAHSSFARLGEFPVDCLKLDRHFTEELQRSARSAQVVETIVTMAGKLACPVIAEGIETETQHRQLASLGCRYGQGYLLGKAMRIEDALAFAVGRYEDQRVGE
ncbi:GGDEF family protein [Thioalkalivibrio nitratireducens DSM 14787]|uniref:GGDEF family protein n=1 Tax=Thioalkalivibrio nitratireducens (strain DSM 14787 / UNIQEM 213 / ALEN2) TaxID=1255043 RepID=L0E0H2_THIND|nr:EAL domain-containing protein [Thioalkalivibrio nitratireducens]AGA34136.1 GGDEF family protein [Thioalkalivibrio nitratireducens DSM 14787]